MKVRLQKFLADAGVASRRASEGLIQAGVVMVNGVTVTELGTKVDAERDQISVEGKAIRARRRLYVALNKPRGYICTRSDEKARDSVMDLLPAEWRMLYPVGRLDRDSEGLLFLTNDGEFCLRLTHPRYGICKKYLVTVAGKVEPNVLSQFKKGVRHQGEWLRVDRARILSANASHSLVELELSEGKNREVRRLFESAGIEVESLVRVQVGPIRLGELPSGKWRVLTSPEVASLRSKQVGPKDQEASEQRTGLPRTGAPAIDRKRR